MVRVGTRVSGLVGIVRVGVSGLVGMVWVGVKCWLIHESPHKDHPFQLSLGFLSPESS